MRANVAGRVNNTYLPKTKSLLPLFEAIINSIDAIEESGINLSEGVIDVILLRHTTLPEINGDEDEPGLNKPIMGFEIHDNGIGFTEENFSAFNEADTQNKIEKGGKGVGRFIWLKAFKVVEIESTYSEGSNLYRRSFEFTLGSEDGIKDHELEQLDNAQELTTIVRLLGFLEEYESNSPRSTYTIAQRIVEHCLKYFVLGNMPKIYLHDNEEDLVIDLDGFYEELVSTRETTNIQIGSSEFEIIHFLLHASSGLNHHICFCANRRVVETQNLTNIKIPNLPTTIPDTESDDEYVYAGYISSKYLDDHVNSQRTGFDTIAEGANLFPTEISWGDLEEEMLLTVKEQLLPYTEVIRQEKEERIRDYVNGNAPEYRHIIKNHPDRLENIPPSINEKVLEQKLHELHNEIEKDIKERAQEYLIEEDAIDDQWDEVAKLWEELNDVGKAELANYVTYRKFILAFLENALKRQETGRYSKEEAIHKLIFPLRSNSDEITYDDHNLWVIDEKLAYHWYLSSDLALSKVEELESDSASRPDLLLFFDRAIATVDEDKPYNSGIVIFEFKKPMRDDYTDEKNPINQVLRYVREIKDSKALDKDGRLININPTLPFYCYIICDVTNKLKEQAIHANLRPTPDGDGFFGYNEGIGAYIEIISFDKLIRDAQKRNRVLFDKLGLPEVKIG